ncbi:MAG: nucleotidyltransferase family protein [Nitrospirae bacterium]|nr:nucleotidyltransferase family protein [Nitrospirota bacterium]
MHPFLMRLLRGQGSGDSPAPHDDATWSLIVTEAEEQDLTFILYRRLRESGLASQLPPALLDDLKKTVLGLTAQNLLFTQELASILSAFDSRRVDCVPLRGPALAELLYEEPSARPMEDLDLLVRREALSEVVDALGSLGYREIDRRPGFAREFSYTLVLVKDRHGCLAVEPHWTIAYPPFVEKTDMDRVWERTIRASVAGVESRRLCPTDLLLHLCLHLLHGGEHAPLLWFYEIDQLIRRNAASLDWAQALRDAHAWGQELLLVHALRMVAHLFHSPLPGELLSELRQPAPSRPAGPAPTVIERKMVGLLMNNPRHSGREEFALFFTLRGMQAKFRYARSLLFPSQDFVRFRYRPAGGRGALLFLYFARVLQLSWGGMTWLADLVVSTGRQRRC